MWYFSRDRQNGKNDAIKSKTEKWYESGYCGICIRSYALKVNIYPGKKVITYVAQMADETFSVGECMCFVIMNG